jgi:hypothetical protein
MNRVRFQQIIEEGISHDPAEAILPLSPEGREPGSSIDGSTPAARWNFCKLSRSRKRPVCGAFAEPSSGLEPETPAYET